MIIINKDYSYKLTNSQHGILCEALRRYDRFSRKEGILTAWTGLGSKATYRSAVDNGYMVSIHGHEHEKYDSWWRLMMEGAAIVCQWINDGFNAKRIEANDLPPKNGTVKKGKYSDKIKVKDRTGIWA